MSTISDIGKHHRAVALSRILLLDVSKHLLLKQQIYSNMFNKEGYRKSVDKGRIFKIYLEGQPSTGYSWALASMATNFYLLSTEVTPIGPSRPGGRALYTFTFKTVEESKEGADLTFKYMRSWKKEAQKTERYTVMIPLPNTELAYEGLDTYFVKKGTSEGRLHMHINSMENFTRYFGYAPHVPGHRGRRLCAEDFEKNRVIAVVLPAEEMMRDIEVNSLTVSNSIATLDYNVTEGSPISYTVRVPLVLLVERGNDVTVHFTENGKNAIPESTESSNGFGGNGKKTSPQKK